MITPDLLKYIESEIAKGTSKDTIQSNLLSGGWNLKDIEEAFSAVVKNNSFVPISPLVTNNINVPSGVQSVTQQNYQTTSSLSPQIKYAGFWIRYVAIIVDSFFLFFCYAITFLIFILMGRSNISLILFPSIITASIFNVLIYWSYFSLMTYYKGATLGKMLVGIKVQSEDGQKLSFGRVILREIVGRIVSSIIFSIGYLMAAFTKKKQALHDKMANTVVVYKDLTKKNYARLTIGIIIAIIPVIVPIILSIFLPILIAKWFLTGVKNNPSIVQLLNKNDSGFNFSSTANVNSNITGTTTTNLINSTESTTSTFNATQFLDGSATDWQIYNDNGFSVKYPPEWSVQKISDRRFIFVPGVYQHGLSLSLSINPIETVTEDKFYENDPDVLMSTSTVSIDGFVGTEIKIISKTNNSVISYNTYFQTGNAEYEFDEDYSKSDSADQNLFRNFYNSFRLTQ